MPQTPMLQHILHSTLVHLGVSPPFLGEYSKHPHDDLPTAINPARPDAFDFPLGRDDEEHVDVGDDFAPAVEF